MVYPEREKGQWAIYYNSPQSFKITFSYLLVKQLSGFFYYILIGWFIKLIVLTF